MGDLRNACKILVAKPEGRGPLWRPKHHGRIMDLKKQGER
jgi:hypothetical protein